MQSSNCTVGQFVQEIVMGWFLLYFLMKYTLFVQMNIWNFIYLNCGEWYEDMIDNCSYAHKLSSCEFKAWKNSGLNGVTNPCRGQPFWYKWLPTMGDKSVETLRNKIEFLSTWSQFPPSPQNNVDFSFSLTAQTTAPTQHWIGGPGVSENWR